jgi:hypothetical protein
VVYQVDSRNHRTQEVRIGQNDQEVAAFQKVRPGAARDPRSSRRRFI